MSDINDEVNAIAEHLRRLNIEFDRYGTLTAQSADAIRRKTAAETYRDAQLEKSGYAAAQSLQSLGKAVGSAAGAMYEGRQGATAFNESIASMNTAVRQAAIALTVLAPGGVVGKVVAGGLTALGLAAFNTVQNLQEMGRTMLDTSYDSYKKLAAAGAATSVGLQGVAESAAKTGVNMLKMDEYLNLIGTNSDNLALFGKSVFDGRKKFDNLGYALESDRQKLFALGMTQDDINESMMGFIRLQTLSGQARKMSDADLIAGTRKYLYEQDELTKLLGMSRKEQQATREAALSEQRFGAKIAAMKASGDARQIAAAEELEKQNLILSKRFPELAQGFRDLSTGMITTEAAQKANMSTQGQILTDIQSVSSGLKSGGEGAYSTLDALAKTGEKFNMAYQMGTGESFLIKFKETSEARAYLERSFNEDLKNIKLERDKTTGGAPGGDSMLAEYAKLLKDQQTAMTNLQQALAKGFKIGPIDLGTKAALADVETTVAKAVMESINRYYGAFGTTPPPPPSSGVGKISAAPADQRLGKLNLDQKAASEELMSINHELSMARKALAKAKEQDSGASDSEKRAAAERVFNANAAQKIAEKKLEEANKKLEEANKKLEDTKKQSVTPVPAPAPAPVPETPPPAGETEEAKQARIKKEAESAEKAKADAKAAEEAKKKEAKEPAKITLLPNGARVLDDVLELVKQGVPVISNVRTQEQQDKLKHHQDEKGNWFTKNNLPVAEDSKHLTGDAIDVDTKEMTKDLEKLLKDSGWMRPLPKSDPGHWQRAPKTTEKKTSEVSPNDVNLAASLAKSLDLSDVAAGLTINSDVATLNSKGMSVSLDNSTDVAKLIMEPVLTQMESSQKDQSAARSNFENSIGDLKSEFAKQKATDELLLAAVQELIRIQKNGVSVNEKILAAQA